MRERGRRSPALCRYLGAFLSTFELLALMPSWARAELAAKLQLETYRAGTVVSLQGDDEDLSGGSMPAGLLMLTGEVTPFTFEDAKSVDFDFYQREIAEIRQEKSMSLKYEPASVPLHILVKQL